MTATRRHRDLLDMSDLCRHTVERFLPRFEAAGLSLTWRSMNTPVMVSADGHRVEDDGPG